MDERYEQLNRPEVYETVTRLALSSREPYRGHVLGLTPGQRLMLLREPTNPHDCQAIRVDTDHGEPVGYLSADQASWLSILLDYDTSIIDQSCVESVLLKAPENDPLARRLRYPRLFIRVRLLLERAWPLFVISAILGIKDPAAGNRFDLAHNPWLMPLRALHTQYLHHGHDGFNLPPELSETWNKLAKTINDNDCNNKE